MAVHEPPGGFTLTDTPLPFGAGDVRELLEKEYKQLPNMGSEQLRDSAGNVWCVVAILCGGLALLQSNLIGKYMLVSYEQEDGQAVSLVTFKEPARTAPGREQQMHRALAALMMYERSQPRWTT